MSEKPKLSPLKVPWMICPSTPFLSLEEQREGEPLRVTFAGYFRPNDQGKERNRSLMPVIAESVPRFEVRPLEESAAYRMVRVSFEDAQEHRVCRAVSDLEVIRESDFDWNLVPIRKQGEKILDAQRRKAETWIRTGTCPNPGMYEVLGSSWLAQLNLANPLPWHHYLMLGHDDYIEVVSRSWTWEPGQAIWQ